MSAGLVRYVRLTRTVGLLAILLALPACNRRYAPTVVKHDIDPWEVHFEAGKAAQTRGDSQTAEREFVAALDLGRREDPAGMRTALPLNALSVVYFDKGKVDQATLLLDEAMKIFQDRLGTTNEHFALLLTNRADMALAANRTEDAERDSRQALSIVQSLSPVPESIRYHALTDLVAALCRQSRRDEANCLGRGASLKCAANPGGSAP